MPRTRNFINRTGASWVTGREPEKASESHRSCQNKYARFWVQRWALDLVSLEMCVVRHQGRTSETGGNTFRSWTETLDPEVPNMEHKEHKGALNNHKGNHFLSRIGGDKRREGKAICTLTESSVNSIRAQHKKMKNSQMQKMKAIQTEKKIKPKWLLFLQRHGSMSVFLGTLFGLNVNIAKKNGIKELHTKKLFPANININIWTHISTHTLLYKVKKNDVGCWKVLAFEFCAAAKSSNNKCFHSALHSWQKAWHLYLKFIRM